MPMGGKVSTPRQVEAQAKYTVTQQTREYNRNLSFYFALSKDRRQEQVRPQTLARLFFSASYLRPNDDRLYLPDGNPMQKKDLEKLMRLKSNAFKTFWREVNGKYIFQQNDKSLRICNDFFRGKPISKFPSILGLFEILLDINRPNKICRKSFDTFAHI